MNKNNIIPYRPDLKKLARELRKNMTLSEVMLWNKIRRRQLGYQFHRQVPMLDYITDFYCHKLHFAIEVDGKIHDHPEISINDMDRQQKLETLGVQFLRFKNQQIKHDIDFVIQEIEDWINLNS